MYMPRLTDIHDQVEEIVIDKQSMIVNERVMVTVSRDGYVKRVSLRSFNANANDTMTGIKETDQLIGVTECDLLDNLLLITSGGNYLYIPVYEIPDAKWKDVGNHLNTLSTINGDKIINAFIVKSLKSEAWIITITKKGMIKTTLLYDLNTLRFNRSYNLMGLVKNDEVVDADIAYLNNEVVLTTKGGNVVRYTLDQLPITSLKAKGVKAINLNNLDQLQSLSIINNTYDTLIVINDKGGIKRIRLKDIVNNNRPVKGDTLFTKKKSNPVMIRYTKATSTYDEIAFYNEQLIKVISKDVSLMGKESTFSTMIEFKKDWYMIKTITEVKIVDLREEIIVKQTANKEENDDKAGEDFEFIALDVFDDR